MVYGHLSCKKLQKTYNIYFKFSVESGNITKNLDVSMLYNINRISLSIATSISILVGASLNNSSAQAFNIPLENASFEAPEQTVAPVPNAGFFDFETPLGWELYDPNSLIPDNASLETSFTGGLKPSAAFFANIPDGEQISTIYLITPGAGEVGLAQSSVTTIEPNTTYTLSAAVLNTPGLPGIAIFEGFPGYRLELLAGDTVIAVDDNTLAVDEGDFVTASVSYTTSKNDIYLGEALSLRLINLNLDNDSNPNGGNGIEVNFDNVILSATSVPESQSTLVYLLGGIALITVKKKVF